MVFHNTNFVHETNAWWLRRIRPLWMTAAGIGIVGYYYRYAMFGKWQALYHKYLPKEVFEKKAQQDKRSYGFTNAYHPTLERSTRKQMMEILGSNYVPAKDVTERCMLETRTLDAIFEEENEW